MGAHIMLQLKNAKNRESHISIARVHSYSSIISKVASIVVSIVA